MAKTAIPEATRGTLFHVDPKLCTIVTDDPSHPLFDPSSRHRKPDAGMIESVRSVGVIQPIILRPDGERYEVVAGRRRVLAALAVNEGRANGERIRIPAVVRRDDDKGLVCAVIVENLQREDLTPSQQAHSFAHAMRFGLSESDLAARVGITAGVIRNRLKLLDVRAEVRDAADSGVIAQDVALQLATLPREEQDSALEAAKANGLNGPQARKLVRGMKGGASASEAAGKAKAARRGMRRGDLEAWATALGKLASEPRTQASPSGIVLATLHAVLGEGDPPKWLAATMPSGDAGDGEE